MKFGLEQWALSIALFGVALAAPTRAQDNTMNTLAERYVRLVLAVGQHDADYVDAYYGPPEWRKEAEAQKLPLVEIASRGSALAQAITAAKPPVTADEMTQLRHQYLARQLEAVRARVSMLTGTKLRFDEESKALYDAVAPTHTEADFAGVLTQLAARLPGAGPLIERYDGFRSRFVIPRERLDAVFKAAIDGCRSRTLQHITLPPGESFTVEYVTNKSWSGYNWYQGNYRSLIQVNTDLPIYVDRAIDLACHEGYPGHHVYNVLLEKNLLRDRGWIEFSVYPLFSPQSLIAEGTANYGIEVAFPRAERLEFERRVLFPAAGLNPADVGQYYDVLALVDRLSYAGNEAARRYLDGAIDAKAAADWLEKYGLYSRPRADQRVRFIDQYRSYVINYNLGKDMVAAYIESRGNDRWREFARLISSPRLVRRALGGSKDPPLQMERRTFPPPLKLRWTRRSLGEGGQVRLGLRHMRAVEISAPGPPEVLKPVERPDPVPGTGEVLIRVAAAGVNRPDVLQRRGAYPPPPGASDLPGLEVAGVIEALGDGVSGWRAGDRVCALLSGGGYATLCTVPAVQCLPIPGSMDVVTAAAIPETFFTVWTNVFDRGRLRAGETALFHGGSSGIGTTAIQLAVARGARVFATAGSEEKCRACEGLGAERAINYRSEDFVNVIKQVTGGRGVDLILDIVGGDYIARDLVALAVEGRLVVIGFMGGDSATVDFRRVLGRRLTITGSTLRPRTAAEKGEIAAALRKEVWPLLERGAVKPVVYRTFPLEQAAAAHALMESSEHIGKIVLTV